MKKCKAQWEFLTGCYNARRIRGDPGDRRYVLMEVNFG